MTDIIINGISVTELKRTQAALQKDAAKFIAESIAKVQQIVKDRLVTAETYRESEVAAQEALELLKNAKIVSEASGVQFYLPYYEEYGGCDSDEILTSIIEDADRDVIGSYFDGGALADLHDLLESMESTSKNWHSSTC